MNNRILVSWLGYTDIKASRQASITENESIGDGPILGALKSLSLMSYTC